MKYKVIIMQPSTPEAFPSILPFLYFPSPSCSFHENSAWGKRAKELENSTETHPLEGIGNKRCSANSRGSLQEELLCYKLHLAMRFQAPWWWHSRTFHQVADWSQVIRHIILDPFIAATRAAPFMHHCLCTGIWWQRLADLAKLFCPVYLVV